MTSPPAADGPSQPVRIEVPTEQVDATVDLVEILGSIASGIERLQASPAKLKSAAATGEEDATKRLATIGELASGLASELAAIEVAAPELRLAIEQESAQRSQ
jgi:hypothetical protein